MELPITLPLDILTSIVDTLAYEDGPDIRTIQMLSQTCKFMVPSCRRHLFSSLKESAFDGSKVQRLSNLLKSNPDIAHYVKSIDYQVTINSNKYDDEIFDVLHRYSSSLQSIELHGWGVRYGWNRIPEPTKSLLVSLIQLPTITHLNFKSISNFPVAMLSLCGNLVDLQFTEVTVSTSSEDEHVVTRSKIPAPTSLSVEVAYDTLVALRQPAGPNAVGPIINFSRLREVSFRFTTPNELHNICELLKMGKQLRYLEVKVNGFVRLVDLGTSLAANPYRTLREACFFIIVLGDGYDPLCGLNLALRQYAGNNVLEELYVDVMVQTNCRCRTDSDDWSDLDAVLTASGAFPMLRTVTVQLSWYSFLRTEDEIKELLNKVTEDRFPRLLESTAVAFEFEEEHAYI